MNTYQLGTDEVVLAESEHVTEDSSSLKAETGNIAITNKHFIWAPKNFFDKFKRFEKYPITSIKVYNGKPQVILDGDRNGRTILKVYFKDRDLRFRLDKKKAREIVEAVGCALTGDNMGFRGSTVSAVENVARKLRGSIDVFKTAWGESKLSEQVSASCKNCGAQLVGSKNRIVKCPYCDSRQKL